MFAKQARTTALTNNTVYTTIKNFITSDARDGKLITTIYSHNVNLIDFIDGTHLSDVILDVLSEEGYKVHWDKFARSLTISF